MSALSDIGMSHAVTPRILFIDAYDSFSNNIISVLETQLHVGVTTIRIDEKISDFHSFLKPFSAVIAGPGPGNPNNLDDVGLFNALWKLEENNLLPVLGICLGFQSLVLAFGGKIEPLPEPRHGILRRIRSNGISIFEGVEDIVSVQYHSLHASLNPSQCSTNKTACHEDHCRPPRTCDQLIPLAWDNARHNQCPGNVESRNPDSILMAVKHQKKPFYGVQFHPESVCSNESARSVLNNWWKEVLVWRRSTNAIETVTQVQSLYTIDAIAKLQFNIQSKTSVNQVLKNTSSFDKTDSKARSKTILENHYETPTSPIQLRTGVPYSDEGVSRKRLYVNTKIMDLGQFTVPMICETLDTRDEETIILDSELHQRHDVGTHSILGIVRPESLKLEYTVGSADVRHIYEGGSTLIDLRDYDGSIFSYLKEFMKDHRPRNGHTEVPFWGGLMGYITYEAGLETIDIGRNSGNTSTNPLKAGRPDLCFVFVERSIVFDHQTKKLYIQSIRQNDTTWIEETALLLNRAKPLPEQPPLRLPSIPKISYPDSTIYKSQIRSCQTSIHAGDAYELCLTSRATIAPVTRLPSWPLYLHLRSLNPAPFSAYIRLGGLTLLSSSPERFLRWSRPTHHDTTNGPNQTPTSTCQFRPIKGTVKRFQHPGAPATTLAEATAILSTPKERAENLMIVDLIRHDLHGVVGSGNVRVSKLMAVEEYATLYQLVTVIEGDLFSTDDEPQPQKVQDAEDRLTASGRRRKSVSGIDVLAASLPPGSMTGAPKRRACKILKELEGRERGVYSGLVGYLDVGGGGDFSVVIRSAVRWDDDGKGDVDERGDGYEGNTGEKEGTSANNAHEKGDTWTIGAGGAVTALSDEEGEWQEMLAKLKSTLGLFEGVASEG